MEKLEKLIHENNLSSLVQDCLQAQVKNVHNKEILNMEKDFKKQKEMLKENVKNEVNEELGKQIEYCQNKIEKLTDIREKMESIIDDRNDKIKDLNNRILIMEDE